MPIPDVCLEGQVVGDVDFRFTSEGRAVARFRMVCTDRRRNDAGEWVDGEKLWITVACFRKLAENVAESLRARDAVIVKGRWSTAEWDDNGTKRTDNRFIASNVGPSLFFVPRPHGSEQRAPSSRPTPRVSAPSDEPPPQAWDEGPAPSEFRTPITTMTEDPWA